MSRPTLYGAGGEELYHNWTPPDYAEPDFSSQSIVGLGDSPRVHQHADMSDEEYADKLKKAGMHRCKICGVPYKTKQGAERCFASETVTIVRDYLGLGKGDPIIFVADNKHPDRRKRRRVEFRGVVDEWKFVRTKRGHEEMPVVLWHPYPSAFPNGEAPASELWRSLLVCVGVENGSGVMTALPWFTVRPTDRRRSI